jgi:hypothetical protein
MRNCSIVRVAPMPKADLTKRSRTDNGYIPRSLREQAHRLKCEACGVMYGVWVRTPRGRVTLSKEAIDHLFPRRWLLNFNLAPNVAVNLLSVCRNSCHPQKIKAENALFEGNALKYVSELRRLHWPAPMLRAAAQFYGLGEIVSLLDREGKLT